MDFIIFLCFILGVVQGASFVAYDIPTVYERSDVFTLQVDETNVTVLKYYEYDYAHISLTAGAPNLTVTVGTTEDVSDFNISPTKLNLEGHTSGRSLSFSTLDSHYLIVKVNALKELIIFIDPAEIDAPSPTGTGVYNVDQYGADNTGSTLSTAAFASAISNASTNGGGVVYVSSGLYLVGNIVLKSHVSLYLEGGAFLYFTGDQSDYTIRAFKGSQQRNITWWISTEFDSTSTKLYGRGTIDGRSAYTVSKSAFEANLVMPINTTAFTFDGPLLRESGTWAFTPTQSIGINISNLKVVNELSQAENDGIDINNCQDVRLNHALTATGDDSYSTKTWQWDTDIAQQWPGIFYDVYDVIFEDMVAWTGCIGWKIGYGNCYTTSQVSFVDGTLYEGAVGAGIDTRYATWNTSVYNITYENLVIEAVVQGHNLTYGGWMSLVTDHSGAGPVKLVNLKSISIKDYGGKGGTIKGYNSSIEVIDVYLTDIIPPRSDTPATTLTEMNITYVSNAADIFVST